MADFSLIANSGIQFHSVKVNLGMKADAMKVNGDFYEKLEEDIEGNKEITFVFPYYHEKLQKYIEFTEEIQKVATPPQARLWRQGFLRISSGQSRSTRLLP